MLCRLFLVLHTISCSIVCFFRCTLGKESLPTRCVYCYAWLLLRMFSFQSWFQSTILQILMFFLCKIVLYVDYFTLCKLLKMKWSVRFPLAQTVSDVQSGLINVALLLSAEWYTQNFYRHYWTIVRLTFISVIIIILNFFMHENSFS